MTPCLSLVFTEPIPNYNISSEGATCKVITRKWDKIRTKDNCTSLKTYQHTQCRGHCDSVSTATYGDVGYESMCTCCQPELTEVFTDVPLQCLNGENRVTNFLVIKTCRCRQFKCVSEPDKSGMEEINSQGQVIEANQQSVRRRRR